MRLRTWIVICLALCVATAAYAATAVVDLKGTTPGSRLKGQLKFVDEKTGVVVVGEVWNAPPGKHGIHIHEKKSCADNGVSAGGHLNPSGNEHGFAPTGMPLHGHPGDMGNIEVDVDGHGTLKVHMPELGLATRSRYDIRGLAVILNEKEDDFSQPDGNSGACIACGLIEQR